MPDSWRLGAADISARIRAGEMSAAEVVEAALARLAAVNPSINAVVRQMPEQALAEAARIDALIAAGEDPGPLAGVPVTVKENVDQQGFATTNGLRLQRDLVAPIDGSVVTALRAAGAIVVGRSNTPAFSLRWFTRNSLHGETLNPRNRALTPGGSSGGAAAAVAAGIGALAHGTDIAGSIRYPAYACGVHGLRPSFGRVATVNPSLPDRHIGAQLTAVSGPIARRIDDLRLGLKAMAAANPLDPWWTPAPLEQALPERRAALCVAPEGLQVDPAVEAELRKAAAQLEDAGWRIDEVDCPPLREAMALQLQLWMSEYVIGGADKVAAEGDPDASFVFAQLREACGEMTLPGLLEALQRRVTLAREWYAFLARFPLLLFPVSAEPPFANHLDVASPESFLRVAEAQLTQIALPLLGVPALTVSSGGDPDRPLGVQLVAARFREDVLLAAGAEIEARNPPIEIADPV